MSNIEEKTTQQQRQRGFWRKLKNPKTLATVFWCVKWIWRLIRLFGGDDSGFND